MTRRCQPRRRESRVLSRGPADAAGHRVVKTWEAGKQSDVAGSRDRRRDSVEDEVSRG